MKAEEEFRLKNTPVGSVVSVIGRRLSSVPFICLLVALCLTLWGGEYLRRDLWEPDEARVGYIAREMVQGSHWLVPHRHGEYYSHKPPLLYWLINLFTFATGLPVGRLSVRLPGFLAGLFVLWATAHLAKRWICAAAAWPAVLTLCTTYLFWHEVGFGRPDGLLLGWTTGAMALLFWNDDKPTFWKPALAWTFMGMGILTKGPVGLIIPAGAYAAARFAAGEGVLLRKSHWVWGPPLALAYPAVWLAGVWLQGAPDGYLRELLLGQNLERAIGGYGHVRPVYYYIPSLLLDLLPWTLCLPLVVLILSRDPARLRLLRRIGGWVGFIFVFFTLLPTKRHVYLLAITPAFALIIGAVWPELSKGTDRFTSAVRAAFIILLLILGTGLFSGSFWPELPFSVWPIRFLGLIATAGGILLCHIAHSRQSSRFFWVVALIWLSAEATVGTLVYPAINSLKTPVALAETVRKHLPPNRPLLLFAMNDEILAYHTNRSGKTVRTVKELYDVMSREQQGIVVFKKSDFDTGLFNAPQFLVSSHEFRSGSKQYVWVEFRLVPSSEEKQQ